MAVAWSIGVVLHLAARFHMLQSPAEQLQFVEELVQVTAVSGLLLQVLGPRCSLLPFFLALRAAETLISANAGCDESTAGNSIDAIESEISDFVVGKNPLSALEHCAFAEELSQDLSRGLYWLRRVHTELNAHCAEHVEDVLLLWADALQYLRAVVKLDVLTLQ
jgi:hypothetical protein